MYVIYTYMYMYINIYVCIYIYIYCLWYVIIYHLAHTRRGQRRREDVDVPADSDGLYRCYYYRDMTDFRYYCVIYLSVILLSNRLYRYCLHCSVCHMS